MSALGNPEALLFDLDGVLADVSGSYREAIVSAARSYGVALTHDDIARAKAEGDANNDWILTQRLLARRGIEAALDEVTARFEAAYQGTPEAPGLWRTERLICEEALFARLSARRPVAIVTGRPRGDMVRFLEMFRLAPYVHATVCMGEAPAKPDPAPVRLALSLLGVERAWMVGDTVDDVRAARGAGVVAFGVVAPGEDRGRAAAALTAAGAARILDHLAELEDLLP